MSYHEKMHRVMWLTQNDSVAEAMTDAIHGQNTVFLPYLFGIVASFFVEPTRLLPIWFQIIELFLFCWMLHRYCYEVRSLDHRNCFLVTIGILALTCLYYDNGGLSDFRMDLSQMLMYGATCLSFMVARANGSWKSYLTLGALAGWCLLIRATSPVYLLAICVPLLIFELTRSEEKLDLLAKSAAAISLASLLAGWYYIANFEYLKFYYLEWNTDANAGLSFWSALRHLEMVRRGIGDPFLVLMVVWSLLAIRRLRHTSREAGGELRSLWHDLFDCRALWMGIAPVLVLIGIGAGLNPFVGMLAIPGIAVFCLTACSTVFQNCQSPRESRWELIALVLAIIGAAIWGLKNHNDSKFNSMEAQRQVLEAIKFDSQGHGVPIAKVGVTSIMSLDGSSLQSILRFNTKNATQFFEYTDVDGIKIWPSRLFNVDSLTSWEELTGTTDEEKLNYLFKQTEHLTHLIVPSTNTAKELVSRTHGMYINKFAPNIKNWVSENVNWVQIGKEIPINRNESVNIFRRVD